MDTKIVVDIQYVNKRQRKPKRTIKNVQSRDTDNIGHMTKNDHKQNKNTTQKTKKTSNNDPTKKLKRRATMTSAKN